MVGTEDATTPAVRVAVGSAEYERAQAVLSAAREAADAPVHETGPTGAAALAPVVLVTADERTAFHANVTPARARELVAALDDGELPTDGAHAVVDRDERLPTPDAGPLAVGRRRVLARCGWATPAALDESLTERTRDDPDDLREAVAGTGLLGRGRGDGHTDEPISEGWKNARGSDGEAVVVVNGNESDPAVDGDRLLLESRPAEIVDGALAVAAAVEATDVVVYLSDEDDLAARRVREAVESVDAGGTGVDIVAGPDSYIAGEMTMALEAMEGADRLEARLRPPGPSEVGLYGRPTVVHTPRTLAQIRAFAAAPDEFETSAADPGTRLLTVTGDGVAGPTTVELATDTALAEAVASSDEYKMACVGGRFGGITRSLDVPASAPALTGARLGTEGGIELFNGATCALELAGSRAKFAREANCGRCVPCREGSKQLVDLLRDVYEGQYQPSELRELSRVVAESSTCEFGQAAPRPITTAMDAFEREIAAHAEGRCPSGVCMESN
ncbi:NADH-ubiquinone oxidoreductase-F iron-sulfur binding region domain-containing protein [Halococcus sediminicola]|uniref:NADH-ubiquinone oxidoreductase-F iron-sulfur binding region domain-containing protein n=1 Tax=Halococcus sediminicola TaxID=1264579 RepID=UPI000679C9BF|nr:NADH-ubiquinone oxidoreductase-F iron-sulfur binding region domain-containing protein [Halococcus sediminicola]